jgi:FixJ family two-component response regulator
LPGASGLEVQRTLTDLNILLPIIFISGHGTIPMSVKAIKSTAKEFLTKPLNEQEILDAVSTSQPARSPSKLHRPKLVAYLGISPHARRQQLLQVKG